VARFTTEEHHADELLDRLADYEGLDHLRARRRADLITLESGPRDQPVAHTRFRRIAVHKWQLEMPLHSGGWDRTPIRGALTELADAVISEFGWMLAARDPGTGTGTFTFTGKRKTR
jgi:hypothetical protein